MTSDISVNATADLPCPSLSPSPLSPHSLSISFLHASVTLVGLTDFPDISITIPFNFYAVSSATQLYMSLFSNCFMHIYLVFQLYFDLKESLFPCVLSGKSISKTEAERNRFQG